MKKGKFCFIRRKERQKKYLERYIEAVKKDGYELKYIPKRIQKKVSRNMYRSGKK